jgi:hypothetical protein
MNKRIPIGVDNFGKLVDKENNYLFVDKTLMIKELIDCGDEVSLILRPRRWGKSLNMSMIRYFFAPEVHGKSTAGMFNDLKIARESDGEYIRKYQGKSPVIFISFKDVKELSWEDAFSKIANLILSLYREFERILANDNNFIEFYQMLREKSVNVSELEGSLKLLADCLYRHYDQKVIIIIDEYDTPLNASYNKPFFEQIIYFFKGLFGASFKGNDSLARGLMTGILRLSKNNMLSDLNNLFLYTMMNKKYSSSFGFFEQDVKDLFEQRELPLDLESIKMWYNGYKSGDQEGLYNPWSILNCIHERGDIAPYWIKTGNDDMLRDMLMHASREVQDELQDLLFGRAITSAIDDFISFDQIKEGREDLIWSALWALGYLKVVSVNSPPDAVKKYDLIIPNNEVSCSYREIFLGFFRRLENAKKYDYSVNALAVGDVESFKRGLQEFLMSSVSYFDLTSESNYHILILGMLSILRGSYNIVSNREAGLGRCDIILAPYDRNKDLGIIIEFKREKVGQDGVYYQRRAQEGLKQIYERKYAANFSEYPNVTRVLSMALVFYGKEFVCDYSLEKR